MELWLQGAGSPLEGLTGWPLWECVEEKMLTLE